jgi:PAS domain S-box-containing protein
MTFFNNAAELMCGYAKVEVLGKNIKVLVPDEIKPDHDGYEGQN